MRHVIFIFILGSTQVLAQTYTQLNSSEFEQWFNTKGQEEFKKSNSSSFETKLQSWFKKFDESVRVPTLFPPSPENILFGASRSLQREAVSFAHPRELIAASTGTTFLGYSDQSKQAEVISWNHSTSQFDFLIIEGLAPDEQPTLRKADRALCTTCHQHGGPIFTPFPWRESSAFEPTRKKIQTAVTSSLLAKANKSLEPLGLQLEPSNTNDIANQISEAARKKNISQDKLQKIRTLVDEYLFSRNNSFGNSGNGFGFDAKVRSAARRLQAFHICKAAKGWNSTAQRGLLQFAIAGSDLGSSPNIRHLERDVRPKLVNLLSSGEVEYPSSVLPDRLVQNENLPVNERGTSVLIRANKDYDRAALFDIRQSILSNGNISFLPTLNDERFREVTDELLRRVESQLTYLEQTTTSDSRNFAMITDERISGIQGFADPSHKRPNVGAIFDRNLTTSLLDLDLKQCFGLTQNDLVEFEMSPISRIMDVIAKSPHFDSLLKAWPPSREAILEALKRGLDDSYGNTSECLPDQKQDGNIKNLEQVKKALDGETVSAERAGQLLQTYCVSCHSGDSERPLALSDPEKFRLNQGKEAAQRLERKKMPPSKADLQPTDEERAAMIKFLRGE